MLAVHSLPIQWLSDMVTVVRKQLWPLNLSKSIPTSNHQRWRWYFSACMSISGKMPLWKTTEYLTCCSFDLSSLMWSCLSNGYVNKQIPNYPLWNKVIECSKKISSLYTLRLFIETCYVQIHCFGMEQNSISPEWEAMNIASELCYAQALVSLNGALYQLAISIKWACLMWIHVHVCAWERVCWCMCGGKDRALIYVDKWLTAWLSLLKSMKSLVLFLKKGRKLSKWPGSKL